jgi:DNA (cytosine-5)-methyltransferase 1
MFAPAALVGLSHGDARPGTGYVRARPADGSPFAAITATRDEALATSPFLTLLRSDRIRNLDPGGEPLAAIVTEGSNHGLVLPLGGYNRTSELTATDEPFRTRVVRDTDALVTRPFLTALRGGMEASGVDEPVPAVMARGHEALTTPPFLVKHYGGWMPPERTVAPTDRPFGVITATGGNHALVVPYRGRRSRATSTGEPLHTMATRDSGALVQPDDLADVMECRLRMLKPREHLRAQRFPDAYVVKGNQGEQTMQAGNAVSANVANWLGRAIAEVLG